MIREYTGEELEMIRDGIEEVAKRDGDTRSCTCHPDDNPPDPCTQKYALSECRHEALRLQRDALLAALTEALPLIEQAEFLESKAYSYQDSGSMPSPSEWGICVEYIQSKPHEGPYAMYLREVEAFHARDRDEDEFGGEFLTVANKVRAALTASKAAGERT
jgi:hypothetical protein